MADIYDRGRDLAIRQLAPRPAGKGAPFTLRRLTSSGYVPGGTTTPRTPVDHAGSAIRTQFALKDIDGTLIKATDVLFLVSPIAVDGSNLPEPTTTDVVLFDGTQYSVMSVKPYNYVGLQIGYRVQARK